MKQFNIEIIEKIDEVLEKDFHPNDLIDEEMPEFRIWRKKSSPFNFLVTYCELITATKITRDNEIINKCLDDIFRRIDCPINCKIQLIQAISNDILHENISVDQDIIMDMMALFEQFDAKDPMLTNKYFKEPLNSQERFLIRTALKESLTCGMIRG